MIPVLYLPHRAGNESFYEQKDKEPKNTHGIAGQKPPLLLCERIPEISDRRNLAVALFKLFPFYKWQFCNVIYYTDLRKQCDNNSTIQSKYTKKNTIRKLSHTICYFLRTRQHDQYIFCIGSYRMTKESKNLRYQAIHSMFVKGNIKRMKEIATLYPTMIAKDLNMNYSRYVERLYKPELFTIKQVKDLAELFELKPHLIFDIILNDPAKNTRPKKKS